MRAFLLLIRFKLVKIQFAYLTIIPSMASLIIYLSFYNFFFLFLNNIII
jgi:hypothetical protein